MGEPIKIYDMVQQLVQLVGRDPDDISIEFTGLRPGEKLMEELYSSGEFVLETGHRKIAAYDQPVIDPDGMIAEIDRAVELMDGCTDNQEVRRILKRLVPDYAPMGDSSVSPDRDGDGLGEGGDRYSVSASRD